jgi:hypothetical protein
MMDRKLGKGFIEEEEEAAKEGKVKYPDVGALTQTITKVREEMMKPGITEGMLKVKTLTLIMKDLKDQETSQADSRIILTI